MVFILKTLFMQKTWFFSPKNVIFPHKREKKGKTRKSRFSRNRAFVMALIIIMVYKYLVKVS